MSAPTVFTPSELAQLRASWSLDQTRAHLDHGSDGAAPIVVDAAAAELRARLNANPMARTHPRRSTSTCAPSPDRV